ncbi:MAG: hypothetical protein RR288_05690, partial [Oscillibacter sp.]
MKGNLLNNHLMGTLYHENRDLKRNFAGKEMETCKNEEMRAGPLTGADRSGKIHTYEYMYRGESNCRATNTLKSRAANFRGSL